MCKKLKFGKSPKSEFFECVMHQDISLCITHNNVLRFFQAFPGIYSRQIQLYKSIKFTKKPKSIIKDIVKIKPINKKPIPISILQKQFKKVNNGFDF